MMVITKGIFFLTQQCRMPRTKSATDSNHSLYELNSFIALTDELCCDCVYVQQYCGHIVHRQLPSIHHFTHAFWSHYTRHQLVFGRSSLFHPVPLILSSSILILLFCACQLCCPLYTSHCKYLTFYVY